MTFSLLVRDPETGVLGGAAATGNLCVGGWVLRGRAGVGMSASQGHFPSVLWGEQVLADLTQHASVATVVERLVSADDGRDQRQLSALNAQGDGAIFSGGQNIPHIGECVAPNLCAAGNMLANSQVIDATVEGYLEAQGSLQRKLLAGLKAGAAAGGDERGLMSASVLFLSHDCPPIDLRVDYAADPLTDLAHLIDRAENADYVTWMRQLPR